MKCKNCNGDGVIDIDIPGDEVNLERAMLVYCPDCDGTGIQEDEEDNQTSTICQEN